MQCDIYTITTFLCIHTIERFTRVLGNIKFKRYDYLRLENMLCKKRDIICLVYY